MLWVLGVTARLKQLLLLVLGPGGVLGWPVPSSAELGSGWGWGFAATPELPVLSRARNLVSNPLCLWPHPTRDNPVSLLSPKDISLSPISHRLAPLVTKQSEGTACFPTATPPPPRPPPVRSAYNPALISPTCLLMLCPS